MEKLQDGKYGDPEQWRPTITCEKFDEYDTNGCGAVYRIEPTDLVLRYFRGTHFTHYYTAIRCLQCSKYTRVKDVPDPVLQNVYTEENKREATFDGFDDSI